LIVLGHDATSKRVLARGEFDKDWCRFAWGNDLSRGENMASGVGYDKGVPVLALILYLERNGAGVEGADRGLDLELRDTNFGRGTGWPLAGGGREKQRNEGH
jgi:hypothetical protein